MPDIADIEELEGDAGVQPARGFGGLARPGSSARVLWMHALALALVHDVPGHPPPPARGGGHSTVAGRLAGAFRGMGRARMASDIV